MTFDYIDVNSLTPFDRKQLLGFLRRKLGDETFESFLSSNGEEWTVQLAFVMMAEDQKQGKDVSVKLASTPRYQNGTPAVALSNLERLRQHMGDNEYQSTLARLGKPAMEEMANKMFGSRAAAASSARPVRTRESSQKINQIFFWIALAYGALLGGGYPDWVNFSGVFDAIFYWVVGGIFVIGLIMVLFFRTAFDFGNIWLLGLLIAALIAAVIGLGANLFTVGIKVLGVAGLAFIGSWLLGQLVARPLFRLLERIETTWMKWVIGIVGVLILLGLLILGGIGIFGIFPVK